MIWRALLELLLLAAACYGAWRAICHLVDRDKKDPYEGEF